MSFVRAEVPERVAGHLLGQASQGGRISIGSVWGILFFFFNLAGAKWLDGVEGILFKFRLYKDKSILY